MISPENQLNNYLTSLENFSQSSVSDESQYDDSSITPYPTSDETDSSSEENYPKIHSKDGLFEYSEIPSTSFRRTSNLNLFTAKPGLPKRTNALISTPLDALKLFISEEVVSQIIASTNLTLEKPLNTSEFWLWVAANLFLGVQKSKNASVEELFSSEYGFTYLKNIISCKRFSTICSNIRFDDKSTLQLAKYFAAC